MWPAAGPAGSEPGWEMELGQLQEGKSGHCCFLRLKREMRSLEVKPHLEDHRWLGRTWTQSSGEPAGQQEESSDQFLQGGNDIYKAAQRRRPHLHRLNSQNRPSASRAMSCRRPVVPRSMPVLSSSSLSRIELAVDESERSVTWPTFIGRPASSKPFSCSKAFFAHSASAN